MLRLHHFKLRRVQAREERFSTFVSSWIAQAQCPLGSRDRRTLFTRLLTQSRPPTQASQSECASLATEMCKTNPASQFKSLPITSHRLRASSQECLHPAAVTGLKMCRVVSIRPSQWTGRKVRSGLPSISLTLQGMVKISAQAKVITTPGVRQTATRSKTRCLSLQTRGSTSLASRSTIRAT